MNPFDNAYIYISILHQISLPMNDNPSRSRRIWSKVWPILNLLVALVVMLVVIPAIKQAYFPDLMTRIERMLRDAEFETCTVQVEHKRETLILLSVVSDDGQPITTELYRDYLLELPQEESAGRTFFAHSINHNPDKSFYLTQTQIWADADLKKVRRIEAEHCGLLEGHNGRVPYEGHRPVYRCADEIRRYACGAAVTED
jgi:hypothetical protein